MPNGVKIVHQRVIPVWDLPLRLFHWALAGLVVAALITAKVGGTNAMIWHGRIGHLIVALIAFRLVWGVIGSSHARFRRFVPGPRAILDYFRGNWHGAGHNPLGALSVIAMLLVIGFQAVSGLFANDAIAFRGPLYPAAGADLSNLLTSWHRRMEWVLYGLVALHLLAVLYYTLVRRDNLILAMLTGRKRVADARALPATGGGLFALLIAVGLAAGAFWVAGGGLLPPPPPPAPDLGW